MIRPSNLQSEFAVASHLVATRTVAYERHHPEETPLYRIVETHYPQFLARLEAGRGSFPAFVKEEFNDYLKSGLLEHGFLRANVAASAPRVVRAG